MGFFEKLKQGLVKTHNNIFSKVNRLIVAKSTIDDEFLEQFEEILLSSDVGVSTTEDIVKNIKSRAKIEKYADSGELNSMIKDEIQRVFSKENGNPEDTFKIYEKPHIIMVVGVNGVGKTTSIGKLAYNYKKEGNKILIAAADTFRAAANEQLELWADRSGAEIIGLKQGSDPSAVVYNAINSAISNKYDVVIIDTAGRLHTKTNLMEELKKIKRVAQKIITQAPHEILLVLDATTGQNGMNQAKQFTDAIGITGLILTKLDGTAKGGIVLKINSELKIPVKYIGVGEKIDDLQIFNRSDFVKALLEDG
ncbi:MAG: signal recognition particle-docking protein FtsY [Ignavibacteria bacterium]|jgi:fused signal recognition particle receptor